MINARKAVMTSAAIAGTAGFILLALWWNGILYDWITPANNVVIWSYGFHPPEITIKKGSTVIWENLDPVPHTVQSGSSDNPTNILDSGMMYQYDKFQHAFNEEGTYEYYCAPHPLMKARIIVVP